jgi:acyl-CoA thioesterase FadM
MWGVTARMSIEFKRPVPIGRPIRAEGRVLSVRRRLVEAEGVILDREDGTLLARSQATFVGASDAKKDELKARYRFALVPDGADTPDAVDHPDTAGRA